MNITILGRHGSGKSILGDITRNTLFRMDSNATISSDDPDRTVKKLGSGNSSHNISIRVIGDNELIEEVVREVIEKQDIVVIVENEEFLKWFRTTQEEE